jgi:hypothetical protein
MVGQIQLMFSLQSLALLDLDVESKILSILMAMKTEKPGTLELQVFASLWSYVCVGSPILDAVSRPKVGTIL